MTTESSRISSRKAALTLGYWPGEGVGPEIVEPTVTATTTALHRYGGYTVQWVPLLLGREAFTETGQILPDETWSAVAGLDGWILGPHDNASYPTEAREQQNPSAALRVRGDLWANIRPVRGLPGAVAPRMDLVVVRENTEGLYADRNMYAGTGDVMVTPDVALAIGTFTRHGVRRIIRRAGRVAAERGGPLTVAHKANVLARTSGMYLEEAEAMAAETGVELLPVHIDALCADLVVRPERHRTIVAENMFGDILSDLTAALGGSLGAAGSINAGDRTVMAQAAHGSAPDIAGRGIANPAGIMNSAAMMLSHLGYPEAGDALAAAVRHALTHSPTPDLAGPAGVGTEEFSQTVFAQLGGVV
ncbi:dehydrogenase [Corynebacterium sp. CNJ-954]|uniref:isocitrate/isopropylmalate family dehydrogenase n=1 Tax=Corynebacterium sp. CNJ-954 TaxID=1904962 RepID=UPI00095A5C28|nr:isocitrate/isopropylmalate family dehydrogenase [Corynebacterium sp. CNJ-954]OLT51394.1 dehydrogenase [Corynebacterium sp. CNJ-954]